MKITRDTRRNAVIVHFEESFGIRDAIALPQLIARLPLRDVVLDFSRVSWIRESAIVAMIPALGSVHGRRVRVRGLEHTAVELSSVAFLPAAA